MTTRPASNPFRRADTGARSREAVGLPVMYPHPSPRVISIEVDRLIVD